MKYRLAEVSRYPTLVAIPAGLADEFDHELPDDLIEELREAQKKLYDVETRIRLLAGQQT